MNLETINSINNLTNAQVKVLFEQRLGKEFKIKKRKTKKSSSLRIPKPQQEKVVKVIIKPSEKFCPKCNALMQRRSHAFPPKNKNYFFTEWDYCNKCGHIQHYEEFKSADWKEYARQSDHMRDLTSPSKCT